MSSQEELRQLWARERSIRANPWAAELEDLAWLSQRISDRLRKPSYEEYHSDPGLRSWIDDPDYEISRENDGAYLSFLLSLLPARSAIQAALIQSETNEALVGETQTLAKATMLLAGATIVLALIAIATLGFAVL